MAALTPTAMIAELRETTATLRSAQARVFVMAAEWADAHPDPDGRAPRRGECTHDCPTAGLPGEDFGPEFLRDRTGTLDVTPTRDSPGSGCRHRVRRQ